MSLDTLTDVFHDQLKDVYSAEKQLTNALPKMAEAATNKELKQAFQHHLDVTQRQFERVSQLLDEMGVNPGNTKCEAMAGLIEEGDQMAQKSGDGDARDAGLIAMAQKIEHYEIATYGSLRTWANVLKHEQAARTLQEILDEEYDADNKLGQIAESHMNREAAS